MDKKFIELSPQVTTYPFPEEENYENNDSSAPPIVTSKNDSNINSEISKSLTPGTIEPSPLPNPANNAYAINNSSPIRRRAKRRILTYKASKLRKIFQIILSSILFLQISVNIGFQIYYGLNETIGDDILIFILATAMMIFSIKGETSARCKIIFYNMVVATIGFGFRVGGMFHNKESVKYFIIIAIIKTVTVFFVVGFNCYHPSDVVFN